MKLLKNSGREKIIYGSAEDATEEKKNVIPAETGINVSNLFFGYYSSVLLTVLTLITFGIALFTPPPAGPWCTGDCYQYPYLDTASRFPRDFYWMYPAIILNLVFIGFMASIHIYAPDTKKAFTLTGLCFGVIAAAVLIIDYFLQISVIQPSLLHGEEDGIPFFSQFNPHGAFIALEETGYVMMSLALFTVAPVFAKGSRLEKAVSSTFITGFFLTLVSFVSISAMYGIFREYRFEVAVISIDWLVLIITGIMLSLVFKRAIIKRQDPPGE